MRIFYICKICQISFIFLLSKEYFMRIRPFQALYPNVDLIASTDLFFAEIKNEFTEYVKSGFFDRTDKDSFYIYEIVTPNDAYIHDYFDNRIKKHEKTLAAKEQKQMHVLLRMGAMTKPVLLTHPTVSSISDLLRQHIAMHTPFFTVQFQDGTQTHRIWMVSDTSLVHTIQEAFEKHVPNAYIADGHHRCSTTAMLYEKMYNRRQDLSYDLLLAAFFPSDQLVIHDYNRVVEAFKEHSTTLFMAKLSQVCNITPLVAAQKPTQKFELTFCIQDEWFLMRWKHDILARYRNEKAVLDATLLNEIVLRDILNIQDVRTDNRVQYVEGVRGLKGVVQLADKVENSVGFCMFPLAFEDLFIVSDADESLPPKSTWFEPRMKNGLIIKEFST